MLNKIKVISFDVDGTLVPPDFINAVWMEGIPSLYAQKYSISFEKACEIIARAYDEVGEHKLEWYFLEYWIKRFELNITKEELFNRYKDKVKVYKDAEEIIKKLSNRYKLIISSNAEKDFIFFQLKPLLNYFHHIFSATSDFNELKKSKGFYERVCRLLDIKPEEMVHVGDHPVFDYFNPREIGIKAFLLNRNQHKTNIDNIFTIKDLREFLNFLDTFNFFVL